MNNFFYNVGASVLNIFKDVNFKAFIDNTKYMGAGMLGIFVVIAVIILVITVLQKFSKEDK